MTIVSCICLCTMNASVVLMYNMVLSHKAVASPIYVKNIESCNNEGDHTGHNNTSGSNALYV